MKLSTEKYSHFDGITVLLEDVYVKRHDSNLASIIELNQSTLKTQLEKIIDKDFFDLMESSVLERMNDDTSLWVKASSQNYKRVSLLQKLLKYTHFHHIEMLEMKMIQDLLSPAQI